MKIISHIKLNNWRILHEYLLLLLAMLFTSLNLANNILTMITFRVTVPTFHIDLLINGMFFLYPFIFLLLNLIAHLSNQTNGLKINVLSSICNTIFVYSIYGITVINIPPTVTEVERAQNIAINIIGKSIGIFYYKILFISILTSMLELFIFVRIQSKIHNFFLASLLSSNMAMIIYNVLASIVMYYKMQTGRENIIISIVICTMIVNSCYFLVIVIRKSINFIYE